MDAVTANNDISFEQVLILAQRLQLADQARLVARLAPVIEAALIQVAAKDVVPAHTPLRGILADLGQAPTPKDIDEARRAMRAA